MKKISTASRWRLWGVVVGALVFVVIISSRFLPNGKSEQQNQQAQLSQGKQAYNDNCASCHGADLKGTRQGPSFIHPVYEPSHHGDEAFYRAAANGVRAHHWRFGDMPPVSGVTQAEVGEIIGYIREQQRANGIK
ncbi:cytochrome c [Oceanisphaera sp. IT1-181]|uniref:c-type cytochrome n=1 Tax=Oceanisphaera sp. IT1-181 TaxID=3081199 RepID=UPI0029CA27B8|nr:cytochrome c [Oceanisphaera sp. IT1-181]